MRTAFAIAPAAAALVAGGCISPQPNEIGVRIGDETLKQFRAGVTTESWLVAILGPPTAWAPVEGVENTKVFRYSTGSETPGLLAFFSGGNRNIAVTYFVITNGIVTRYWADRAREHTIFGKPVEADVGAKQEQ